MLLGMAADRNRRGRHKGVRLRGRAGVALLAVMPVLAASGDRDRRLREVTRTPGLVAFWDFVKRDAAGGRFDVYKGTGETHDFRLDALNYVRGYWGEGREAGYGDFPLLGRGPFGQAIEIRQEREADFRPCLVIPRSRLDGSGLDVKGPGRSVSMVAWVARRSGNHAIAGIWHEGTDLKGEAGLAKRVERGQRQYALFAGLGANEGASAVHVSENGAKSFGDKYARNLAVTPEKLKVAAGAEETDNSWSVMGFTFDNGRNTVTAYLDGKATEYWIEEPQKHGFFKWPAAGWLQAELKKQPGIQDGEDPAFPEDQYYQPPETKVLRRQVQESTVDRRVELWTYEFTKVRVTLERDGKRWRETRRELAALKVNPFWFGHDLWTPGPGTGGPFTIGRVIHSSRSVGFTGWIGGVAVFGRALTAKEMKRLARIGVAADGRLVPLPAPEGDKRERRRAGASFEQAR